MEMSKPIFPVLRKEAPILDFFRQKVAVQPGQELTPAQRAMAEEFRVGMAEALGVPPEAIREEIVQKWVRNWSRAFVKPQFWMQRGYIRKLGQDLVKLFQLRPQPEYREQETRMPPRGTPSEGERRERYSRSELSVA